jgi:hypothetical protein
MSKITTLHNIPNIPNSNMVLNGLWSGGDVSEYENNPDYKIYKYYGYASWFPG